MPTIIEDHLLERIARAECYDCGAPNPQMHVLGAPHYQGCPIPEILAATTLKGEEFKFKRVTHPAGKF